MFIPGWLNQGRVGNKLPELSFQQVNTDDADQASYSFTSQGFGDPHPSRLIVCVVLWRQNSGSNESLSSATIGGVTATIIVQGRDLDTGAANQLGAAIIQAEVPTGTSGTIALTFSGSIFGAAVGTYRLINLQSTTPTDSGSDTDDIVTISNLAASKNGVSIGCAIFQSTGTVTTDDTDSLITEDFDATFGSDQVVGASAVGLAASSTYQITFDGPSAQGAGAAAVWR